MLFCHVNNQHTIISFVPYLVANQNQWYRHFKFTANHTIRKHWLAEIVTSMLIFFLSSNLRKNTSRSMRSLFDFFFFVPKWGHIDWLIRTLEVFAPSRFILFNVWLFINETTATGNRLTLILPFFWKKKKLHIYT